MVSVHVIFNGASIHYEFFEDLETFMRRWNNQLAGAGYFTSKDTDGKLVIINPSNCGTIEIVEKG